MSDEDTRPDTLLAILAECKAAREAADRAYAAAENARTAAEKSAEVALQKVQEKHDLGNMVQKLQFRVDQLALIRLPLSAPWLALVMSSLAIVADLLLAWKVFR